MPDDLDVEDREAIEQAFRRFVREQVTPRVQRPEHHLELAELAAITDKACELGLLDLEPDDGHGLWCQLEQPNARRLTLDCLGHLARVSAGVAIHFHQLALGAWLSRRLGVCDGSPTSYDLLGGYGMGRHLLPRQLRSGRLEDVERAWLSAYFDPTAGCPRLLQLGRPVDSVLMARYDAEEGALAFERVPFDVLGGEGLRTSHGLDETETVIVRTLPSDGERLRPDGDALGVGVYRAMLELHSLGLCAISLGVQQHSFRRAAEYAELRVQGGATIIHHPAVQALLGRVGVACASAQTLLDGLTSGGSGDGLVRSLSARAVLSVEGCAAANDALQLFGGSGYMRDNGLEKLVRDQNHLRVFWGTPDDLRRFVSELEREP